MNFAARRWTAVSLGLLLAGTVVTAVDASAAGNVKVGVGGAAPAKASYSGQVGPGNPDPLGPPAADCTDPNEGCQRQAVDVEMPAGWTKDHAVTLGVSIKYGSGGNSDLDVGIFDSKGNLLASAFAVADGQTVQASNITRGTYTIEVDGDITTGPQAYTANLVAGSGPKFHPPKRGTGGLTFSRPTLTDPYRVGTEPNIAVSPSGKTVYESPIFGFSTTQSFLERSTNGGRTWNTLGLPGVGKLDQCTGGGDSDLATDMYEGDIYMIDLGGAPEVPARVSADKGLSFSSSCEANFHDGANYFTDRQWLSTDRKHHVEWYIYRDGLLNSSGLPVVGATDIGKQGYGEYLKFAPLASGPGKAGANQLNFSSLCKASGVATPCFNDLNIAGNAITDNSKSSPRYGTTYLAMSRGTGVSVAAFNTSSAKSVKEFTTSPHHQPVLFPTVAVDKAGTVYMTYTDDTNFRVYEVHSVGKQLTDKTCSKKVTTNCWSKRVLVSGAPVVTTVMPWVVAGSKGRIDVVFYGTSTAQSPTLNYGPWFPYLAQSLNATSGSPTWSQAKMSDRPNHIEPVCLSGLGCTTNTGPGGDRELGDFFKVALDDKGRALVSFADGDNQLGHEVVGGPAAAPSFADFVKQSGGQSVYKNVGELNKLDTPAQCSSLGKHHNPVPFDVSGAGAQGPDVPALQLRKSCIKRTSSGNLRATLTLAKLDLQAATTPPAEENSTFLVRWVYKNKVYFAAAEDNAGQLRYFSGQSAPVSDGLAIKYAYYPASGAATGSTDSQSNTITINVPAKAVGNPPLGAKLSTVTAYTTTHGLPTPPSPPTASNFTDFPQVTDSLPSYSVLFGGKKAHNVVVPIGPRVTGGPRTLPITGLALIAASMIAALLAARSRRRPFGLATA